MKDEDVVNQAIIGTAGLYGGIISVGVGIVDLVDAASGGFGAVLKQAVGPTFSWAMIVSPTASYIGGAVAIAAGLTLVVMGFSRLATLGKK